MKTISIKTQNRRGNDPKYKENLGYASIFISNNAIITVDKFEGTGETYKEREKEQIQIIQDGKIYFNGSFEELKSQLIK